MSGDAFNKTEVPAENEAEHVVPQLIPVGTLLTSPVPVPAALILIAYPGAGAGPNVAVTASLAVMLTLHDPVPLQAPLHPLKTLPDVGVAARLTEVPEA